MLKNQLALRSRGSVRKENQNKCILIWTVFMLANNIFIWEFMHTFRVSLSWKPLKMVEFYPSVIRLEFLMSSHCNLSLLSEYQLLVACCYISFLSVVSETLCPYVYKQYLPWGDEGNRLPQCNNTGLLPENFLCFTTFVNYSQPGALGVNNAIL